MVPSYLYKLYKNIHTQLSCKQEVYTCTERAIGSILQAVRDPSYSASPLPSYYPAVNFLKPYLSENMFFLKKSLFIERGQLYGTRRLRMTK